MLRCIFLEFITFLLQSIGTYVDPTPLVQKIANGTEIPGLKNALVKMLYHYNLQVIKLHCLNDNRVFNNFLLAGVSARRL